MRVRVQGGDFDLGGNGGAVTVLGGNGGEYELLDTYDHTLNQINDKGQRLRPHQQYIV